MKIEEYKIEEWEIERVKPYENNPRRNEKAISSVKASIKEFGFRQPIVVDDNGTIICGHTRLLAAKELGYKKVPIHIAKGLTEEKIKAYRIADNRSAEFAEWDKDLLEIELKTADLSGLEDLKITGLLDNLAENLSDESENEDFSPYTNKIKTPIYEVKGDKPKASELYDKSKTEELIKEIESFDLQEDIKKFLEEAACRHTVFNFRQIAEYYCHASKEIQHLFERSGLVIIDFNKAIENGFVHMTHEIGLLAGKEDEEDA
jgi:hypothetical protein